MRRPLERLLLVIAIICVLFMSFICIGASYSLISKISQTKCLGIKEYAAYRDIPEGFVLDADAALNPDWATNNKICVDIYNGDDHYLILWSLFGIILTAAAYKTILWISSKNN